MRLSEHLQNTIWPRRGIAGWTGYACLSPLSALFGVGVSIRNAGYRIGLLRTHAAPLPVVSIGNLAVGGTGKRPCALWMARSLHARGLRTAILSRGYGGRASAVTVVSKGRGPEVGPAEVGDEPVMLAKAFPGGVVITSARRIAGAIEAERLGCDVAVLDDGFQHRAIGRAFDIVLFDGRRRALLPAGPLRERTGSLRRADAVVLVHRSDLPEPAVPSAAAQKPVYRMSVEATALVHSVHGQWKERPVGTLSGQRVVAVSGIGQPNGFYELLRHWEAAIEEVFEYPDHHAYTRADWQDIARNSQNADLVVTTEKDLVKLEAFPFATGKLVALRVEAVVERGEELVESVLRLVDRRPPRAESCADAQDGLTLNSQL